MRTNLAGCADGTAKSCRASIGGAKANDNLAGKQPGPYMEVIAHARRSWFLLTDGQEYYADILCTLSGLEFSLLIKLTKGERLQYKKRGTPFIYDIAHNVQRSPPMHYHRNQSAHLQKMVVSAIFAQAKKRFCGNHERD